MLKAFYETSVEAKQSPRTISKASRGEVNCRNVGGVKGKNVVFKNAEIHSAAAKQTYGI